MKPPASDRRQHFFHAGSFLLAGMLLYLALRQADFQAIGRALQQAHYVYLLPLTALVMLSHWLRAWRWRLLLESLPEARKRPERPSILHAFGALMIGYMVNYAAPRVGEVARALVLAGKERLPFTSVAGTVVIERLLDVATLFLAVLSVLWLHFAAIRQLFLQLVAAATRLFLSIPLWLLVILVLLTLLTAVLSIRWYRNGQATSRIRALWQHFLDGMLTLFRTPHKPAIALLTVAMWGCYLLMAYIPFVMFGYEQMFHLTLLDAWSIMILGSLGVAIPSPGGTGSYHYITIETLTRMFGVDPSAAATYAIVTHAAQLVLYTLLGGLALILMDIRLSTLLRPSQTPVHHDAETDPAAAASPAEHASPAEGPGSTPL